MPMTFWFFDDGQKTIEFKHLATATRNVNVMESKDERTLKVCLCFSGII